MKFLIEQAQFADAIVLYPIFLKSSNGKLLEVEKEYVKYSLLQLTTQNVYKVQRRWHRSREGDARAEEATPGQRRRRLDRGGNAWPEEAARG